MAPSFKKILNIPTIILGVIALTVLTQIGGFVFLIALASNQWIQARIQTPWRLRLAKFSYFAGLYLLATFLIIPLLARPFGRVPLPIFGENLRPLRFFTCLLNRHYVRVELKTVALDIADEMQTRYPGTKLSYLDANFPFFDGFPLIPHLSHNDGKKLDLAFCYRDAATGKIRNGSPSWLGYGVYEAPQTDEQDQPAQCAQKGQWQYSFIKAIVPQGRKSHYAFDAPRTKAMIELFATQPSVEKLFIEPHLKARLGLNSPKVRYHGCQAVRHDDHVHVQVR
jgi:hypothetical protein